jgi:hypothetical protein
MSYVIYHIPTDSYCSYSIYTDEHLFRTDIPRARQWKYRAPAEQALSEIIQDACIMIGGFRYIRPTLFFS